MEIVLNLYINMERSEVFIIGYSTIYLDLYLHDVL